MEPAERLDVELWQQAMSAIAAMRYRPSLALANVVALVAAGGRERSITPLPSLPCSRAQLLPEEKSGLLNTCISSVLHLPGREDDTDRDAASCMEVRTG